MKTTTRSARPAIRTLWRLLLLAPAALLLGGATEARAANLDEALLKASPDILIYLKEKGYKNVGVLPFKLKKGTRAPSYLAGPLATNFPGRLENALIMGQGSNEARAVGIIRDAAATANKEKVGSFTQNPLAFRKLFDTKYTLAWGQHKVKADAFVTGVVNNTGDRSKTLVQVQVITKTSRQSGTLKLTDVGKPITVNTDRALLRDMGYTFALSRSALKRGVTAKKRDLDATDQVAKQDQGQKPQKPTQSSAVTPDNIAGMAFELRYDGAKQALRPLSQGGQGAKGPQFQADPPTEETAVTMVLTRLLDDAKSLGVVLKVNGRSTFQEEEADAEACRKWVYDVNSKNKPDEVLGFYREASGKNVAKFRVLSAAESATKAAELGDRAGWIDIDVFESGEGSTQPKRPGVTPPSVDGDEAEMKVSTRGLARSKKSYATLKELQEAVRKANRVKLKKTTVVKRGPGGLLLPEMEATEEAVIEKTDLPNPIRVGGISIQYYDRKSGTGEQPGGGQPGGKDPGE